MTFTINGALFRKPLTWIIIAVGCTGLAGGGFYIYKFKPNLLSPTQSVLGSQTNATTDTQKILAAVSRIIDLPQGETPTVATITDVSKLAGQDFFKNAHNGDQVIIYTNAKKAYLYDPRNNRIIDVEPISVPTPTEPVASPSEVVTPTLMPSPTHKIATPSATLTP